MSAHGNEYLQTPNLDNLASESVEFTRFYSSPLCAPSRASLLTGRQFLRTGVWGVHRGRDYINLDETTFVDVLQKAGYRTAMMGKWHSGHPEAWKPWNRGFDQAWEVHLYSHENGVTNYNGEHIEWQGWTTDKLTDKAIDFMSKNKEQPFFCYLSFLAPHAPWYADEKYVKKYLEMDLAESISTCFGMIEQIDYNVGRLIKSLKKMGLDKNTIVIYTSDNGPINEAEREWGKIPEDDFQKRNPNGLRGRKGEIWENGIRIPFFVRWPERFKPSVIDMPAHLVDIYPTILDLAGANIPVENKPLDGISLLPLLEQGDLDWPDRLIFNPKDEPYWPGKANRNSILPDKSSIKYENQVLSVMNQQFKMVKEGNHYHLFDLTTDQSEKDNIIDKHPELVETLKKSLRQWYEGVLAEKGSYSIPRFPIGDLRDKSGYIYACAAVSVSGNVQGGSHATHGWSTPGDAQTLNINILNSGKYKISLDAKVDNPSALIRVRIGEQKVEEWITKSNKIELGEIELTKGEAQLVIELLQVGNIEGLVLERLNGLWINPIDQD